MPKKQKISGLDFGLFTEEPIVNDQTDDIVIQVVIEDSPVDNKYDYLVPQKLLPIEKGQRVQVPFGKGNRKANGFCIAVDIQSKYEKSKLKYITDILDEKPLIDENLMSFAEWISSYYVCSLGQTLCAMVPSAVKKGIGQNKKRFFYLLNTVSEIKSTKQKKIIDLLSSQNAINDETSIEEEILLKQADCGKTVLKSLNTKGLIKSCVKKVLSPLPVLPSYSVVSDEKIISLNDDQQSAIDYINSEVKQNKFGVSLLYGVTDSGKTEVYIQAIENTLKMGKNAIVLVPEIALTAQTVQRFRLRFENVAVMHSGLKGAQRNIAWHNILQGNANVVIGARSAIFAPIQNLGLIIVDEEHESSYKQDTVPRYHGRDAAIKRAHLQDCHIVLGSATPSLESYHNCLKKNYYKLLRLPKRVKDYPMPQMKLVDMRDEGSFSTNPKSSGLISQQLSQSIKTVIAKGEQAILLLNRRGYSNYVFCPKCRHTINCRNCDVSLTFHKSARLEKSQSFGKLTTVFGGHNTQGYAVCHYCLSKTLVPETCPMCKTKLIMIGLGSQRLEEELKAKFPQAKIARIDSDSMQAKDYYNILNDFAKGNIDILAGTQMLAKGLHFPNVTLVGVISADTSLTLPDFRANERTYQLISQVAGRAGRGSKEGTVIIQSLLCDQAVIKYALKGDFAAFVDDELKHRQNCMLPPFGRVAKILIKDEKFQRLEKNSKALKETIDSIIASNKLQISIRGPMPASIARIQRQHRNQIILQAQTPETISSLFYKLRHKGGILSSSNIVVDIDPINLL